MNIDAVFLPVAEQLINGEFGTDIVYHQHGASVYNPVTGTVTGGDVDHAIKAGVLNRSRVESGGPSETYEISLWVHHGATGLSFLPTTADSLTYDSVLWRVIEVNPTYSSKTLIASKIKGRSA